MHWADDPDRPVEDIVLGQRFAPAVVNRPDDIAVRVVEVVSVAPVGAGQALQPPVLGLVVIIVLGDKTVGVGHPDGPSADVVLGDYCIPLWVDGTGRPVEGVVLESHALTGVLELVNNRRRQPASSAFCIPA
ncbi:hypothetical protein [Methylocaldum szegediense]|uniref:CheW-like domain-containing protein n=1 Tax=Methylocaldum szegediense TaxID=73780 RepID=A0ABN8X1Z9_9GAMM|nr:hypothetical protein [Methylocaldum szegediense]CAI8769240.1 protein of unknown function [Methylocaldum szegediense]